jgi:ABC-type glycerol-3-phosphate transport system substrate-binding protein
MPPMTRRELVRLILAAAGATRSGAGGTPSAAQTSKPSAPAVSKGITLRVMAYPFPVTQMIRDSRAEYEKQTGVKVEWDEAPWNEALSKQMAELVARTGRYDLFTIEGMWVGQEAGTGQLLELDEMIGKAGGALDWEDFVPKRRQLFVYKGKVIGLPLETNITMAAYRKDVFEQAGIKPPAKGTGYTHEEWLGIMKRLHKDGQVGTAWPLCR